MTSANIYRSVVLGTSWGGLNVLKKILSDLPSNFGLSMAVVQHIGPQSDNAWIEILNGLSKVNVKEADEKEAITAGTVYVAPPNYHLLIEPDYSLSLSVDERVNYARPSIDVLFETAAIAYQKHLIGIVLTGTNSDGVKGLKSIKEYGGLTVVQDPDTAEARFMPQAAIEAVLPDHVLSIEGITKLLRDIHEYQQTHDEL